MISKGTQKSVTRFNVRYGTRFDINIAKSVLACFPLAEKYALLEVDLSKWDEASALPHPFTKSHPFKKVLRLSERKWAGFPSVSVLNGCVGPKKVLYWWQQNQIRLFGQSGFMKMKEERMGTSSKLHQIIALWMHELRSHGRLRKSEAQLLEENEEDLHGFLRSVIPFFTSLPRLEGERQWNIRFEDIVTNQHLAYRGRFDAVMPVNGHLTCVDWKAVNIGSSQEDTEKRAENMAVEQAKMQLAAYIHAINSDPLLKKLPKISRGAIVQIFQSGKEAELVPVSEEEIIHHHQLFLGRINAFWWTMEHQKPLADGNEQFIDFVYRGPSKSKTEQDGKLTDDRTSAELT